MIKTGRKIKLKIAASVMLLTLTMTCSISYAGIHGNDDVDTDAEELTSGGGYAVTGQLDNVGYSATLYNAESGLPTSDANYIYASKNGYIWIGGYAGVMVYDGVTFDRLDSSTGITSGKTIYQDKKNRMWYGTNDNGVVYIDNNDEQVHITYKDGLPSSTVRTFAEDNKGNVFIGTTGGVAYVDVNGSVYTLNDYRIKHQYIIQLRADENGVVYGNTRDGDVFSIKDCRISEYYKASDLGMTSITAIYPDEENSGMLYFGTDTDMVYYGRFGSNIDELKAISVAPASGIAWITQECGRVWINSDSVVGYLNEDGKYVALENLPMDSSIEMLTADYQGNLWLASTRQGVMKIATNNFENVTAKSGINDVVNATCMRDGLLYVGTDKGLYAIDEQGNLVSNELTDYIGETRVRCILLDKAGDMWVSTYTNDMGLVCLTSDGQIVKYTEENGLINNQTRCINETSDGSILVGTNGGLTVIKDHQIIKNYGEKDGLDNTVILTLEEGDNGSTLVGTDGDGLYVISHDKVDKITRDDGLTSDVILRVKKDEQRGVYWIVTSNSIQYMKDGRLYTVDNFPYNNNFDIYYDDDDNLWVLSSYGIFCVNANKMLSGEEFDYRLYNTSNGMTSVPTGNAYSYLDESGNLYVSSREGVNKVNINNYFDQDNEIKVDLKYIYCDGDIVYPDENGEYIIPSDAKRIYFYPAVLDFSMSNPTVKMFFEGYDDGGVVSQQRDLDAMEFTELKHGNYTLHIQVLNPATEEVSQDVEFTVVKKPKFFEIMAVRAMLVAIIALGTGFLVWRIMNGTIVSRQYREIREAKEEAERANTAKTRFLANMSHEIRTPINTIMGMNEMILREDATDVPKEYFLSVINYAADIKNATESLLGMINDVLDMSKIESGKMHLVEQEYDMEDMLRGICSMIRGRAAQKDLIFEVKVDEIMPMRFYGDVGKIKQIVLNLLTNAVKYTTAGTVTLSVSVEEIEGDIYHLKFSVKDTGMGVKEEDIDKLFTAYERMDEEKNSAIQGTGLGLNISAQFAEILSGKLTCESVYGEGSDFILTVNQKAVDKTPIGEFDDRINEAIGPYVPQFVAPDAEILIVDDNPMNLSVIKSLLKSTKMFITTATSGEECLEKLRYGSFNIVLLDHMMPGMDGVETCRRIRENYPDLPVYALTANATAGEDFYVSNGFNGYLAKPIDSRTLEKTIMRHIPEEIMMKADPADVVEELTEIPESLNWIYDIDTISVDEGIKNSGGVDSYIFSLQLFFETIDGNANVIKQAYDEGDITLYTVKVHALKSSARIIGDLKLSKLCEELEDAGNKENITFIQEHTPEMFEKYFRYKELLEPITEYNQNNNSDKELIPEEELKDAYEALSEVIPMMDYDSVEMILEQIGEYKLPEKDEKQVAELTKLLKQFDWDKMEEIVKELRG